MSAGAAVRTEHRHVKVPYINERKKYDLIIAASGQIVYDYDLTTGDIVWSGSLEQVLGYEREEMGGIEEWAAMIHPEDRAEALRLLDVAEKERGTYDVDYRLRCKNGSYRWLHDRGFFLIEDDRNVRRMIGMMQDIHSRKQAELLQNAVYRIAQAADTSAGLGDLFKSVHNIVGTVMPAGNFYIALYDDEEDLISFPYFVDEEDTPPSPKKPGKGLTEHVIRTGRPCSATRRRTGTARRGHVELVGCLRLSGSASPSSSTGRRQGPWSSNTTKTRTPMAPRSCGCSNSSRPRWPGRSSASGPNGLWAKSETGSRNTLISPRSCCSGSTGRGRSS